VGGNSADRLQTFILLAEKPARMSALINWLNSSQDFFRQLDWLGVALFAAAIVLAQMFIAPLSPMAVGAGLIFGLGRGWVAITLGTGIGAAINFLIARYVARGAISRRLAGHEKFRLIDAAIGREGWKIVALLRFVPMPFGLANHAYGLTAISFWPYLFATVFAIIPANALLVWLGATAHAGLAAVTGTERPRHPAEYVLLAVGIVAALLALRHITKLARAAVAQVET
jgi:uncharacterized membrane protein YdjX (TVP38/TMEM64 family)